MTQYLSHHLLKITQAHEYDSEYRADVAALETFLKTHPNPAGHDEFATEVKFFLQVTPVLRKVADVHRSFKEYALSAPVSVSYLQRAVHLHQLIQSTPKPARKLLQDFARVEFKNIFIKPFDGIERAIVGKKLNLLTRE